MARKYEKIRVELTDKEKIKRNRKARGGRTLPRSGAGVHQDKKAILVEEQLAEEAQEEMENWRWYKGQQDDDKDEEPKGGDVDDDEFWEEWKYPDDCFDDLDLPDIDEKDDKSDKDKEKKDAPTDNG